MLWQKNNNNIIIQGISGHIGKQIIIKQYSYGTVISKYPDRTNIKPTKNQLKAKAKFAQAVLFAKEIISNNAQKIEWQKKVPTGSTVYHTAIKWYMKNK